MQEDVCWPGGVNEGVGVQRVRCGPCKGRRGQQMGHDMRAGSLRMGKGGEKPS